MKMLLRLVAGLIAGVVLLFGLNEALDPVPVAAGPAFLIGAAGFAFVGPAGIRLVASLAFAGAAAGVLVHRHWHLSGQSPQPEEGLLQHLLVEGLLGYFAALLALAAMGAVIRWLGRGG